MLSQHPNENSRNTYNTREDRYEIIDGKKVMLPSPTPNHTRTSINITRIFSNYLNGKQCEVFSELDVKIKNNTTVKPDVMVICDPSMLKNINEKEKAEGVPDLIVEVLSPSTSAHDRIHKMKLYAEQGVKEYWLVDTNNFLIEIYLLSKGTYVPSETYHLYSERELEDMTEEEKDQIITEFKTSVFDDLIIPLKEVFLNVSRMPK